MILFIDGIGIKGPGINNWETALPLLNTPTAFDPKSEIPPFRIDSLPPMEKRRSAKTVKIAVDLADQAISMSQMDPQTPSTVFASTSGDSEVLTDICTALATEDRMISPLKFHNSTHNAPSGYWTIAHKNTQPSTSIALHELTSSAALIESATIITAEQTPVLTVIYDIPFPPPLAEIEKIPYPFGISFLFKPSPSPHTMAKITVSLVHYTPATTLDTEELEKFRGQIPSARLLPLLWALAHRQNKTIYLDYISSRSLQVDIENLD